MPMILLVEDDPMIVDGLRLALELDNWSLLVAQTKAEALTIIQSPQVKEIALYLLDMGLPDGTGLDICQVIRQTSQTPIIFLTAHDDEVHTVLALEAGADDYLAKPFRIQELRARIKAVLRRSDRTSSVKHLHTIGRIQVNTQTARVHSGQEEIVLTGADYRLLSILIHHRGQVLSRQQLLDAIFQEAGEFVTDNSLTVAIKRLRQKLGDPNGSYLETIRGLGYRLKKED